MTGELEKRLLAVITGALAGMAYRPADANTGLLDAALDAIAAQLVAALTADGWRIEPDDAALDSLFFALRHGVMSYKYEPPRGWDLAGFHDAIAKAVKAHITHSGFSIEPGPVLRKASPRKLQSTAQFIKRDDK